MTSEIKHTLMQYLEQRVGPDDRREAMKELSRGGVIPEQAALKWAKRGAYDNTKALLLFCTELSPVRMGEIAKLALNTLMERNMKMSRDLKLNESLTGKKGSRRIRNHLRSNNWWCNRQIKAIDEILLAERTIQESEGIEA